MEITEYKTSENFRIRLEARIKNAELARARESLGLTVKKAAEMIGVGYHTLCAIENLKCYPSEKIQQKECDFYRNNGYFMVREDIFPSELSGVKARKMIAEKEIPKENLVSLSYVNKKLLPVYNPREELDSESLGEEIKKSLDTLARREAMVIKLRFGLDNREPLTLQEVGKIIGIDKERVRQIEARTLKKLRHPIRSKILREFV